LTIQRNRDEQDTLRRQTNQKHNTENQSDKEFEPHQKPGVNPGA